MPETSPRFARYWWVLAFQGGAINAGGILSCGRSVSHVTGYGTYFGTQAAQGRWSEAWQLLSVPAFFLLGAIATTLIRKFYRHRHESVAQSRVLFIIMLLIAVVFLLGYFNFFGPFNAPLDLSQHYALLVILGFVCGMQNAIFSATPHGVVRSTHLTGPLTDLGVDIGNLLSRRKPRPEALKMMWNRVFSISGFVLGGLLASYAFLTYEYLGFVLPLLTALYLFYDAASWRDAVHS